MIPHRIPEPDYDTKSRLHLGVNGEIVQWNDERGFGFASVRLSPAEPPIKVFVHASALRARHLPPQAGEKVWVKAQYADHKWSASEVSSPHREAAEQAAGRQAARLWRPMRDKLLFALPLLLLWPLLLAAKLPKLLLPVLLLSAVALALYAWDKSCALRQGRRVPEAQLHLLALLGGWPGALAARYLLRHKTVKQPFVVLFWLTVLLNMAALLYVLFRQPESLALLWQPA